MFCSLGESVPSCSARASTRRFIAGEPKLTHRMHFGLKSMPNPIAEISTHSSSGTHTWMLAAELPVPTHSCLDQMAPRVTGEKGVRAQFERTFAEAGRAAARIPVHRERRPALLLTLLLRLRRATRLSINREAPRYRTPTQADRSLVGGAERIIERGSRHVLLDTPPRQR